MATIYEVADLAGVSPKTAARILAGAQGRPANHERVLAAARKLGYVRNQQAANLRSGRSGLVGVIVPDIANPFYPTFLQTIHDALSQRGYQILLSSTFGKQADELQALRVFEMNRVEGIILNSAEGESDGACDTLIARFIEKGVPVVLAGRPARGLPVDEIIINNTSAIERVVRYLFRSGRRRLAFLAGQSELVATREREAGFRLAHKAEKKAVWADAVHYGEYTAESGRRMALTLLNAVERPDAIVAANDLIALGAIRACRDLGLRVPEDVAVTGFDGIAVGALTTPALTTLQQPQERIAREVVQLIAERIAQKGQPTPPRQLSFMPELVLRESA